MKSEQIMNPSRQSSRSLEGVVEYVCHSTQEKVRSLVAETIAKSFRLQKEVTIGILVHDREVVVEDQ